MKDVVEYIDRNNNEEIKRVLYKYGSIINLETLLIDLKAMYKEKGIKEQKELHLSKIKLRKKYFLMTDIKGINETLTKAFKGAVLELRRHYHNKVLGALFEVIMERNYKPADKKTDRAGWDLIDSKNKRLIQLKCGKNLILKTSAVKIKWALKNGYEEYSLVVLWYNLTNNKIETITLKDAESAGGNND